MINLLKRSTGWAYAIVSAIISFIPESFFAIHHWCISDFISQILHYAIQTSEIDVVITRLFYLVVAWVIIAVIYYVYFKYRKRITISGHDYTICIEYGDILTVNDCKRVISFDECYTTKIGKEPQDINEDSLCGQYLQKYPIPNIQQLVSQANVKPDIEPSWYQSKTRYKSGTIVPRGNDLLLAFAPLDKDGLGRFPSIADYMESLSVLWCELDKHYGQKDVCIPILGSGVTRFSDSSMFYSQQELLDLMIISYKKSLHKLQGNAKLRIICKKSDNFSLNHIISVFYIPLLWLFG